MAQFISSHDGGSIGLSVRVMRQHTVRSTEQTENTHVPRCWMEQSTSGRHIRSVLPHNGRAIDIPMRAYVLAPYHDARLPHSTTSNTQQPIEQRAVPLADDMNVSHQRRIQMLQAFRQGSVQVDNDAVTSGHTATHSRQCIQRLVLVAVQQSASILHGCMIECVRGGS